MKTFKEFVEQDSEVKYTGSSMYIVNDPKYYSIINKLIDDYLLVPSDKPMESSLESLMEVNGFKYETDNPWKTAGYVYKNALVIFVNDTTLSFFNLIPGKRDLVINKRINYSEFIERLKYIIDNNNEYIEGLSDTDLNSLGFMNGIPEILQARLDSLREIKNTIKYRINEHLDNSIINVLTSKNSCILSDIIDTPTVNMILKELHSDQIKFPEEPKSFIENYMSIYER